MTFRRVAAAPFAVVLLAVGLGAVCALVVPAGLPYDEPSHWDNVLFYAQHGRMPTIGERGSTYESQMGPVYYLPAAAMVRLVGASESSTILFVVRLVGAVLLGVFAWTVFLLGTRFGLRPAAAAVAALVAVVNPLTVMMFASVSNDGVAILLATIALVVAMGIVNTPGSGLLQHALLGVLIGIAVLAKVTALFLLVAVPFTWLVSRAWPLGSKVLRALVVVSTAVVTCGWWFVRNVVLYGDLTGAAGVRYRLQVTYGQFQLTAENVAIGFKSSLAYVVAPVEYYRNAFELPLWLRVGASLSFVAVTYAAVVGARRRARPKTFRPESVLLASSMIAMAGTYAYFVLAVQWIPVRLMWTMVGVASVVLVAALQAEGRRNGLWIGLTVVASLLSLGWILGRAHGLPSAPYWIFG